MSRLQFHAIQLLGDQDKFVPSQTGNGVFPADRGNQALADHFEQLVAGIVPQGIVDQFEVIQIDEEQGAIHPATHRGGHRLPQPVMKQGAIGQAGELVVISQFDNLVFGFLVLGHVEMGADIVRDLAFAVLDG